MRKMKQVIVETMQDTSKLLPNNDSELLLYNKCGCLVYLDNTAGCQLKYCKTHEHADLMFSALSKIFRRTKEKYPNESLIFVESLTALKMASDKTYSEIKGGV